MLLQRFLADKTVLEWGDFEIGKKNINLLNDAPNGIGLNKHVIVKKITNKEPSCLEILLIQPLCGVDDPHSRPENDAAEHKTELGFPVP